MQIEKHTGAIKRCSDADLVIIAHNPLENIRALEEIQMVMNDGKVIINKIK